jgi:hypothetical protein
VAALNKRETVGVDRCARPGDVVSRRLRAMHRRTDDWSRAKPLVGRRWRTVGVPGPSSTAAVLLLGDDDRARSRALSIP